MHSDGTQAFINTSSVSNEFAKVYDLTNEDLKDIEYLPIPDSNIIESIMSNEREGIFLVISRPEIRWDYENFKVHMFTANKKIVNELKVLSVERYRDGGTTYYKTDKGIAYSPTGFNKTLKPYWEPSYGDQIIVTEMSPTETDLENKHLIDMIHKRLGTNWPIIKIEKK
jgi:hypothetical protein